MPKKKTPGSGRDSRAGAGDPPAHSLNMKKEYRAELKQLGQAELKVARQIKESERQFIAAHNRLTRQRDQAVRGYFRERARIERRSQILEGRLS